MATCDDPAVGRALFRLALDLRQRLRFTADLLVEVAAGERPARQERPCVAVVADHADARRRLERGRDGDVRALVDRPEERLLVEEPAPVRVAYTRHQEAALAI